LSKTERFLVAHDLPADRLFHWEEFKHENSAFDLVLHDLGDSSLRRESLSKVLSLAHSHSFIVLDDANVRGYNLYVRNLLDEELYRSYCLRSFTIDFFKRYSMLISPKNDHSS